MNRILVWDLPLRLFHWGFAASLSLSLGVGLLVDHDRPLFQLHMLSGLVAGALLVLRLALGLAGSRHARFASFPVRPAEIAAYFVGAITGAAKRYAGHNPGAALAAVAMFALTVGLLVTGLVSGGETLEEAHEVLAYSLLTVVGLHLAGLVLHTLRHRENIAAAMITGRRAGRTDDAIASAHPGWGLALLAGTAAGIVALFNSHDPRTATVTVPVVGTVLHLGENDGGRDGERREPGEKKKRRHDDD